MGIGKIQITNQTVGIMMSLSVDELVNLAMEWARDYFLDESVENLLTDFQKKYDEQRLSVKDKLDFVERVMTLLPRSTHKEIILRLLYSLRLALEGNTVVMA